MPINRNGDNAMPTITDFTLTSGIDHTSVTNWIKSIMGATGLAFIEEIEHTSADRDLIYRFERGSYQPSFLRIGINNILLSSNIMTGYDTVTKTATEEYLLASYGLSASFGYVARTFNSLDNKIAIIYRESSPTTWCCLGFLGVNWLTENIDLTSGIGLRSSRDIKSTSNNPAGENTLRGIFGDSLYIDKTNPLTGSVDAIKAPPITGTTTTSRYITGNFTNEILTGFFGDLNIFSSFTYQGKQYMNISHNETASYAIEINNV
jgi:hypothetical protein